MGPANNYMEKFSGKGESREEFWIPSSQNLDFAFCHCPRLKMAYVLQCLWAIKNARSVIMLIIDT